ncbi:hypothetical protein GCM10010260_81710 [Streptomyces filipinensis]|uniref:Uncharacterized protein n=1 Tax=Streptomyces filipinensis TaxID=66887 RepID=A0A918MG88_9ACTN|nr:type IV toxin-antitoxin system AbiEi family antitoxin domain-containing protein [Streptomyces filipinensis]GGV28913.1 hypothetical protein GCM10010260_81710 [Streptomyces filipinensis]
MSSGTNPAFPLPGKPTRRRRPLPTTDLPVPDIAPRASQQIDVPAGHGAYVYPLATSTAFIGGSYSMDSLTFMLWASKHYAASEDRFILVVLVALIGSQDIGGHITKKQEEIAEHLGYSRRHVGGAQRRLMADGVLRRVRRGVYQLVPSAVLRGGTRKVPGARTERVQQLDLLREILQDPDAPAAFKAMANGELPEDPHDGEKGRAAE